MAARSTRAVPHVLAAVDLGSNSFHMVVARHAHGRLLVIDRLREMVRLGAGVEQDGRLDQAVAARALGCLQRFGRRLRELHADGVRVVGTSALRRARCKETFLEHARAALGHPVEIISGMEEARLIYLGVAHTTTAAAGRRLVVDIGGGSTELIIGEGLQPLELGSVHLGCVASSERFFAGGRLSEERMRCARLASRRELEPIRAAFERRGWEHAFGSSGTVRAIAESIRELDPRAQAITRSVLEQLVRRLAGLDHIGRLELAAVTEERRAVFAGGVAILAEIFATLGIEEMRVADGALREGLLHDMVGRFSGEDVRERTVRAMQQRYRVDLAQAERVESTAAMLLVQVQEAWGLADPLAELSLRWAARLHEIGLDVARAGHHRHGAYLLEHADMPGFASEEQRLLARLVGGHRRRLSLERLDELAPPWDAQALYLIVLLRLAVLLHRGRSGSASPPVALDARPHTLEVSLPRGWLQEQPLTAADLQDEVDELRPHGFRLRMLDPAR